jgi:hypothetical protein
MLVILAISIAAITVLAVIAPSLLNRQRLLTEAKGKILRVAIDRYNGDGNSPLPSLVILTSSASGCTPDAGVNPPVMNGQCGPYVSSRYPYLDVAGAAPSEEGLYDGWGTLFSYTSGTDSLKSCGPDRTCGSGGDDIDFP